VTIPASQIVSVTPGVLSPGGVGLVMNGLVLTESLLMPTGTVLEFASAQLVSDFFGPASDEYAYAQIYFAGFNGQTIQPKTILFAPYNAAARAGWLQSGSFANITLAQLKAITPGTLTITFAGTPLVSSSIDLSAVASFTAAAAAIQAAFTTPPFTVTWDAVQSVFIFTSAATGATETIAFPSDTIATPLLLTQATGATLSQGAVADTPATAMSNAVAINQNWATVSYITELDLTDKEALAAWLDLQDDYYLGVIWDSDTQASVQNATEPFGVVAKTAGYDSVMCIGGDPNAVPPGSTLTTIAMNVAAFFQGMVAAVNFNAANGRICFGSRSSQSAAVVPTCANQQTYLNLLANGYNCYGAFASRTTEFIIFSNGNMPGKFPWADQYVDQIWLNAALQQALLTLYTTVNSIPYDPYGYGLIRAALQDPISKAQNFGAIQSGVILSAAQAAEVNGSAGLPVASVIQNNGYYLQILDPGAITRNVRQTPVINLWYTDGGCVQQIDMASIDIL
jgi:Protein of unknown function (DUF3383)